MANQKKRVQLSFSPELLDKVNHYCAESGISKSSYFSLLAAKDLEDTEQFLNDFKADLQAMLDRLEAGGE